MKNDWETWLDFADICLVNKQLFTNASKTEVIRANYDRKPLLLKDKTLADVDGFANLGNVMSKDAYFYLHQELAWKCMGSIPKTHSNLEVKYIETPK